MMDALRAKFLPRFLTAAGERLAGIRAGVAGGDLPGVAALSHTLAGEASMLGLDAVAGAARGAEIAARRGDRVGLAGAVTELSTLIAGLTPG